MSRSRLSLLPVAAALLAVGCAHCDTCDDFPSPCTTCDAGGSYTQVLPGAPTSGAYVPPAGVGAATAEPTGELAPIPPGNQGPFGATGADAAKPATSGGAATPTSPPRPAEPDSGH